MSCPSGSGPWLSPKMCDSPRVRVVVGLHHVGERPRVRQAIDVDRAGLLRAGDERRGARAPARAVVGGIAHRNGLAVAAQRESVFP